MKKKRESVLTKVTLRNILRSFLPLVLAVAALSACKENAGKEILPHRTVLYPGDSTSPVQVFITIDSGLSLSINPKLSGFNTAFTYSSGAELSKQFVPVLEDVGVKLLRFPGGTVGNYYHPDSPGYGFQKKEVGSLTAFRGLLKYQTTVKENIKVPFTALTKDLHAEVIVVVNMVTGTPIEALALLDYFKQEGVQIAAIELGNELYFKRYRKQFPDVASYIKTGKIFSEVIRKRYPTIPILVCAPGKMEDGTADRQPPFFSAWNEQLSKESFFDGYAVHAYFDMKKCKVKYAKTPLKGFACLYEKILPGMAAQINDLVHFMQKYYGDRRQLWITEWNINPPGYWSNTFAHGAVVSEMLMAMATDSRIIGAAYHNLAAANDNYAIITPNSENEEIKTTMAYQVFSQFNALMKKSVKMLPIKVRTEGGGEPAISVWEDQDLKRYIWFVNPFGNTYSILLDSLNFNAAKLNMVRGQTFMSGAKGNVGKAGKCSVEEIQLNVRNLAVPPFSWGIIELENDLTAKTKP